MELLSLMRKKKRSIVSTSVNKSISKVRGVLIFKCDYVRYWSVQIKELSKVIFCDRFVGTK